MSRITKKADEHASSRRRTQISLIEFSFLDNKAELVGLLQAKSRQAGRSLVENEADFWKFVSKYEAMMRSTGQPVLPPRLAEAELSSMQPYHRSKHLALRLDADELLQEARDEMQSQFRHILLVYLDFRQTEKFQRIRKLRQTQRNLPIARFRKDLREALDTSRVVIVAGDTGCGKSTQVPQYLYDFGYRSIACAAGPHEKRLLHALLDNYNSLERPVVNESDPLQLSFGLTLMQIIDVDEKNQLLITNIWLKLEWNDMNLRWNSSEFGGVRDLRIPPHRLWKPDVLMYNSADEGFDGTYATNVVVRNNGSCLYVPPGIFKSTCKIDITWFPFDDQRCEMKFGSWTYDGFQLDLQLQDEGVPGKRNEIYYICCPEPYIDITFAILIRRKTLYYFFNLIVPCVLIASMALLGFTLPPDSGEKLSLGVTILLSLTVFLNMVAETMPATSDAVPLLGTYFNCIMFMVASSVVSTILILNYHHRNPDTHEMSEWIRVIFLYWLPCILRMQRPGQVGYECPPPPSSSSSSNSGEKKQQIQNVELKERSSKSLLANVLDIDDDFRCNHRCASATLPHQPTYYRTMYSSY
ncbi:GM22745 [Drosophila sechellia]|uniref:GM22745 n=1 Tax=Drosophila sechellia TaxID=7238 RepID=B4I745_DROSE|nr:GM22745 [Drosophila sechellia]